MGMADKGLSLFQLSFDLLPDEIEENSFDAEMFVSIMHHVAALHYRRKNVDEAIRLLTYGIEVGGQTLGTHELVGSMLISLGRIFVKKGLISQGMEAMDEALSAMERGNIEITTDACAPAA